MNYPLEDLALARRAVRLAYRELMHKCQTLDTAIMEAWHMPAGGVGKAAEYNHAETVARLTGLSLNACSQVAATLKSTGHPLLLEHVAGENGGKPR